MLVVVLFLSLILFIKGHAFLATLLVCLYFYVSRNLLKSKNSDLAAPINSSPSAQTLNREKRFFRVYEVDKEKFWSTPIGYTQHQIPKRTGGSRTLLIPQAELKALQKNLLPVLEKSLKKKIHKCAHAYVRGRSIKTNAIQHAGNKVIVKMDIEKFFDSVTAEHLSPYLRATSYAETIQSRLIELLITDKGLPQGAPTSPLLANVVMYKFDVALLAFCLRNNFKYTRYADDITVSLPEDDSKEIGWVIKFVEENLQLNGFKLNKKPQKLNVLRPHQAQRICGVTINSGKPTISRKERRKLRAARHYQTIGKEPSLSENQLQGHEGFVKMIMREEIYHRQCYWCYRKIAAEKILECPKCDFVSRGKTLAGLKKHWKKHHHESLWVFENICEAHSKVGKVENS